MHTGLRLGGCRRAASSLSTAAHVASVRARGEAGPEAVHPNPNPNADPNPNPNPKPDPGPSPSPSPGPEPTR